MSTLELRKELHKYIDIGDNQFLDALYKTAKKYMEQKELNRMITEGEEDIKNGNVKTQDELQELINNWTQEK